MEPKNGLTESEIFFELDIQCVSWKCVYVCVASSQLLWGQWIFSDITHPQKYSDLLLEQVINNLILFNGLSNMGIVGNKIKSSWQNSYKDSTEIYWQ